MILQQDGNINYKPNEHRCVTVSANLYNNS